jgi:alkanesulfonate monooxygenase SsuD/methylene tetrahydromethanopterin reductase-like flavin-dependent oxidoreductase (luciferase family)
MALGLALAVEGSIFPASELHHLIEVARLAEAAGADYVTVPEHVLMGPNASTQDPWSDWEPDQLDMPWPEPLLTLAAMSAATTRIGLVSAVVIAPLRPAGLHDIPAAIEEIADRFSEHAREAFTRRP